ncbi:hypothetical protein K439DRAFT_1359345 [Ramaria rubella]|nr:hypothetical protein K439DRAFT_1359345 [Ramaria rubella]
MFLQQIQNPQVAPVDKPKLYLELIVAQLNIDIKKTVLPSCVSSGPKSFGATEHGKLSADEWRNTGLIRLIITLPRIWGSQQGHPTLMLDNFMHLTNALVILSTRAVIISSPGSGSPQSTSDLFQYLAYLQGRITLYPTAKIQPTEHIAYHLGKKMDQFGPVHNTSANAMERFNGMLQDQPMNMHFVKFEAP